MYDWFLGREIMLLLNVAFQNKIYMNVCMNFKWYKIISEYTKKDSSINV